MHDFGKDHGIHDDHGQGIENHPRGTQQRIAVLGLKFALDATQDEGAICPQGFQ